ncbi:MAG: DUF4097 family beta strand repeat-containing protein [Acutalibacteraceae bacterium]
MNKCSKKWLGAAVILIIAGAVVLVGALAVIRFDFTKLSTQKLETNTYEFNEDFDNISVNAETAAATFVPSDNDVCKVECVEEESLKHSAKIQDGTLTISAVNNRKWCDYICMNFWSPKVTVYAPREAYTSLSVATVTGNIEIPDKFSFETVNAAGTTSDIACRAQVSKSVEVNTTTGSITLGSAQTETVKLSATTEKVIVNDVACNKLTAKSSTGHIQLKNVIAEGSINVQNTTGGVEFEGCDAADILVHTSTGDVKGTLLSEKIFITDTSTGRVSVPETTGGGKCEITTSTGNIDIGIK